MPSIHIAAAVLASLATAGVALLAVHSFYRRPLKRLLDWLDEDACSLHEASVTQPPSSRVSAPSIVRISRRLQQLRASNLLLHQQAIKDPLTGLGNRRLLEQRLEIVLPLSRRWMRPVSLLMIDVDHFKEYNDLYGHQAGDDCLLEIANVLRDIFRRETDIVIRLGGEEFLVVLLDADKEKATELAEAMRDMLEAVGVPHEGSDVSNVVTVSIGVTTTAPGRPIELDRMIASADAALYQCKAQGRNCVTSDTVPPSWREDSHSA
ncbi:GGDEF domain-containing protein [Aidingimonas lacisalsi]|uniref:GGDEF domain-containing protein n=1 Tax=Aidingimonas lacisalsi TaxID=2604086 RepID=UPI0011D2621D|nr:GGDEF domain-containing protein [Aidingimonas lacisalsi]